MNFTSKDVKLLKEYYFNFLQNLKQFLLENDFSKIEKIIPVVHHLLENGYFTDSTKMKLDVDFDYIGFPTYLEQGIQVMYGVCCCRHANSLQKNLLQCLGYEQAKDVFYFVDEKNIWHKKENDCGCNHQVASIYQNNTEIILDAYNGFTFKRNHDGSATILDRPLTSAEKLICTQYEDHENIQTVSRVLKKYYELKKLGIKYVYDEEEYGIN